VNRWVWMRFLRSRACFSGKDQSDPANKDSLRLPGGFSVSCDSKRVNDVQALILPMRSGFSINAFMSHAIGNSRITDCSHVDAEAVTIRTNAPRRP
jgi:hypothetical protein